MHRGTEINFDSSRKPRHQVFSLTSERYGQIPVLASLSENAPLRSHRVEADRMMHGYVPARRGEAGMRLQTGMPGDSDRARQYNRDLDKCLRNQMDDQMRNKLKYQKPDQNTLTTLQPIIVGGKKQGGRSVSYTTDFGHQFGDTRQLTNPVLPQMQYKPAKLGGSAVTNRGTQDSHLLSKEFEMDQIQRPHAVHADHQQHHLASQSSRVESHQHMVKHQIHSHNKNTQGTTDQMTAPLQWRNPLVHEARTLHQPVLHRIPTEALQTHINRKVGQTIHLPPLIHSQSLTPLNMVLPVMTSIKTPSISVPLLPKHQHIQTPGIPNLESESTRKSPHTIGLDHRHQSSNIHAYLDPQLPTSSSHKVSEPKHMPLNHQAAMLQPYEPVETSSSHQTRHQMPATTHHTHQAALANQQTMAYADQAHIAHDVYAVQPNLERRSVIGQTHQDTDMDKLPGSELLTDGITRGPNFRQESVTTAQNVQDHSIDSSRDDSHQAAAVQKFGAPLTSLTQASTRINQTMSRGDNQNDIMCASRTSVR